jgi:hypothetical protein
MTVCNGIVNAKEQRLAVFAFERLATQCSLKRILNYLGGLSN